MLFCVGCRSRWELFSSVLKCVFTCAAIDSYSVRNHAYSNRHWWFIHQNVHRSASANSIAAAICSFSSELIVWGSRDLNQRASDCPNPLSIAMIFTTVVDVSLHIPCAFLSFLFWFISVKQSELPQVNTLCPISSDIAMASGRKMGV